MALRLLPEHNNVIALRYVEDASPVHLKVSGYIATPRRRAGQNPLVDAPITYSNAMAGSYYVL